MSPKVGADLQRFKQVNLPGYLAMSVDGRTSGSSYCRAADACNDAVAATAIDLCRKASKGTDCAIYASKSEISWKGDVALPDVEDTDLAARRWYTLPAVVTWTGNFTGSRSYMLLPSGGRPYGWFKLARSPELPGCYGSFDVKSPTEGRWSMSCGPNLSASGTYTRASGEIRSTGTDSAGKSVEIVTKAD